MSKDPIQEAVIDIWRAGIGANALLEKVKERLKNENNELNVEVTKPKIKAAKMLVPYSFCNDDDHRDTKEACSGAIVLSEERIQFVSSKIDERQNHRKSRRFQEADQISRGLNKMGVILNDANKTWSWSKKGSDEGTLLLETDSTVGKDSKDGNQDNGNGMSCKFCKRIFESRNLIFKHLRDVESDCGNRIFA